MSKRKSHEDSDAQYEDSDAQYEDAIEGPPTISDVHATEGPSTISDVHGDTQAILQNTKDILNSTKKIMEGLLIIVGKLTAKSDTPDWGETPPPEDPIKALNPQALTRSKSHTAPTRRKSSLTRKPSSKTKKRPHSMS